jgi:hypothetical protein
MGGVWGVAVGWGGRATAITNRLERCVALGTNKASIIYTQYLFML